MVAHILKCIDRSQNWLVAYMYKGYKVGTYEEQLRGKKSLKASSDRM
jgi:hypothetical protein